MRYLWRFLELIGLREPEFKGWEPPGVSTLIEATKREIEAATGVSPSLLGKENYLQIYPRAVWELKRRDELDLLPHSTPVPDYCRSCGAPFEPKCSYCGRVYYGPSLAASALPEWKLKEKVRELHDKMSLVERQRNEAMKYMLTPIAIVPSSIPCITGVSE